MKSKILTLTIVIFFTYFSATPILGHTPLPMEPQTEFEQLAMIMAKYGNNAEGLQAINYAILQKDEPAIDLLLKYGATLEKNCFVYAIKTESLELVKKFIDLGFDPNELISDRSFLIPLVVNTTALALAAVAKIVLSSGTN
jgi:hypothetical protein